jgi:hypothetical protein
VSSIHVKAVVTDGATIIEKQTFTAAASCSSPPVHESEAVWMRPTRLTSQEDIFVVTAVVTVKPTMGAVVPVSCPAMYIVHDNGPVALLHTVPVTVSIAHCISVAHDSADCVSRVAVESIITNGAVLVCEQTLSSSGDSIPCTVNQLEAGSLACQHYVVVVTTVGVRS